MTGAELAHRIRRAAAKAGVPTPMFIRPISGGEPGKFLRQLEAAQAPRRETIERIEALIAGQRPPAAPTRVRQIGQHVGPLTKNYSPGQRATNTTPQPVTRDPCPRCGIRADIGCKHQRPE